MRKLLLCLAFTGVAGCAGLPTNPTDFVWAGKVDAWRQGAPVGRFENADARVEVGPHWFDAEDRTLWVEVEVENLSESPWVVEPGLFRITMEESPDLAAVDPEYELAELKSERQKAEAPISSVIQAITDILETTDDAKKLSSEEFQSKQERREKERKHEEREQQEVLAGIDASRRFWESSVLRRTTLRPGEVLRRPVAFHLPRRSHPGVVRPVLRTPSGDLELGEFRRQGGGA